MDYRSLGQMLGFINPGGSSSHPKRPSPITPEMKRDADYMEAWRKSGKTFPLYRKFGANPKAT